MKLFIAGDSTASKKQDNQRPESGWGEYLKSFIPPNIDVINYATDGRSTKSFIAEGRLFQIETEITEGDYLIVQFGHNDSSPESRLHTDSDADFLDNLERFATTATYAHAMPIFISPITRRDFIDGKLNPNTLGNYPKAMENFCKTHGYPFIDMFKISQRLISQLGEDGSKIFYNHLVEGENENYPDGISDDTHFSPYGARMLASVIAIELRKYI